MGTNYHVRFNMCKHCNRYEETHIGKNSVGWQFMFHATEELRSCADWFQFLSQSNIKIFDEYGKERSPVWFINLVKEKQKGIYDNHAELYPHNSFLDKEGYSMTENEFS